jgi:S-adenosyl-L-methionine hydrolase (adenosine-forming)
MIVLFTDFGAEGPYVGQMKAVLVQGAPGVPIVDLQHDAPAHDPRAAAYLLAALAPEFPAGSVFLAVVDPEVGGARRPLVVEADGRHFVGPDNGLFAILARRAGAPRCWTIDDKPARLSPTFHGRDLFAPVAARLAAGGASTPVHWSGTKAMPDASPPGGVAALSHMFGAQSAPGADADIASVMRPDWPDDLGQVIYVDRFGNAVTGVRASTLAPGVRARAGGRMLGFARTFSDMPAGQGFWFANSNGLAEIAVNQGRADKVLGLGVGSPIVWR